MPPEQPAPRRRRGKSLLIELATSPTGAAVIDRLDGARRGRERRLPVRLLGLALPGVFDHRIPLRIVDVSGRGLGVESGRPLPFHGGLLRLGKNELVLSVGVAWSRLIRAGRGGDPTYRSGLELLEPSPEQVRSLLRLASRPWAGSEETTPGLPRLTGSWPAPD